MAGARCPELASCSKNSVTFGARGTAVRELSPLVQDLRRRWDVVARPVLQHLPGGTFWPFSLLHSSSSSDSAWRLRRRAKALVATSSSWRTWRRRLSPGAWRS